LYIFLLDKLLRVWYNGNSGRGSRQRPANYTMLPQICQEKNIKKIAQTSAARFVQLAEFTF
jgi:hypothetical protein